LIDVLGASWSPDGRWLVLDRCTGSGRCPDTFSIVRPDGTGLQPLPGHALWSPDGQRMAVAAADGRLLIGRGDGSELHSIGTYPAPVSWSPDGQSLVYLSGGDAWTLRADGGDPRNLTEFELGGATGASWSPDGRYIVVRRALSDLWLFSPDGRVREQLAFGGPGDEYSRPIWSPDSTRLALDFWTRRPSDPRGDQSSILVVTIDGRRQSVLSDAGSPVWSPDGRFLGLANMANTGHGAVDVANADGSGRWTVWSSVADGSYTTPSAWLP
jgi:Tol biopolymer transport system component